MKRQGQDVFTALAQRRHEDVQAAIGASADRGEWSWTDERFDPLAQRLFAHQYKGCGAYRHYCAGQGVTPSKLATYRDIPAVPTEVFRTVDLCTFPPAEAAAVFHTSGTTAGRPGRHFLRRTDTYEASLAPWLDAFLLPAGDDPIECRGRPIQN